MAAEVPAAAGAADSTGKAPAATRRYALGIEYDGGEFSGWQRLSRPGEPDLRGEPTVQGAVEEALSFVAGRQIDVTCAARGTASAGEVIKVEQGRTVEQALSQAIAASAEKNAPVYVQF